MGKPTPSRPAQFRALLNRAAIELGLPRAHDVTQRLATVRLERRTIRDLRQLGALSGRTSDPSKLLDIDDRLKAEEQQLVAMAPRESSGPMFVIEPTKLIERERAPSPVVEVKLPVGDDKSISEPSEMLSPDAPKPEAAEPSKQSDPLRGGNIIELDRNRSRDIHHGRHAVLKTDVSAGDPNLGSFRQDPSQRDPHPADQTWPIPEPLK
jgi:hypothetical protein